MPKYSLGYASNDFEGFEVDRGIPRGLVMRDQMRSGRPFTLAGLSGGFSGLEPPFPEWYTAQIVKSTDTLTPRNKVVARRSITNVGQAMDYAAAGWKAARDANAAKARDRYRFAWDLGNYASRVGISAVTHTQLVGHLKNKLASADQAFDEFSGKAPTQSVESASKAKTVPTTDVSPGLPAAPSFDTKKILTIVGVSLLGLVMFVTLSAK